MKEFAALRPKMCSYLTDDGFVNKKAKRTPRPSLNTQMLSRMTTKVLNSTIQERKEKS